MPRIAIFDLDGTLVDSAPDLQSALGRLMATRGLPGFSRAEVVRMVGDGVHVLLQRAFAARGLAPDAAALDEFMADYGAHAAVETAPFPGIPALLEELVATGWRLAVCTNKPVGPATTLLRDLGLAGFFAAIGGGDSYPVRKPDPAHLLATLRDAGGEPGNAVMIGDHHNDVSAAAGAGVPVIFAGWGYGLPEMAGGAPVARSVAEVPALLARLRPGPAG